MEWSNSSSMCLCSKHALLFPLLSSRLLKAYPLMQLIGWKDGGSSLLVDPEEIGCLERVSSLNEEADCVHELYADGQPTGGSSSVWQDMVMSPSRALAQRELKAAIEKGEARFRPATVAAG